jgi:hypothetical protein
MQEQLDRIESLLAEIPPGNHSVKKRTSKKKKTARSRTRK